MFVASPVQQVMPIYFEIGALVTGAIEDLPIVLLEGFEMAPALMWRDLSVH